MTEPTTPPTEPTEPTEGEQSTANSEAAKYRRQLRAAEAERDTLKDTLEATRRSLIEGIAARDFHVGKPDAIWRLADIKVGDLLTEAGDIDNDKVGAAVNSAIESLGLRVDRPRLPPSPHAGTEPSGEAPPSWAGFLSGGKA